MYAIELYVPKYNNQEEPIPDGHWANLEHKIIDHFGGFTRIEAVGHWHDVAEPVVIYRIITAGIAEGIAEAIVLASFSIIREIAEVVRQDWQQCKVLYTIQTLEQIHFV